MTDSRESPLRRLADAVDIYLSHRDQPPAAADAVMARHADLRDLLEPLLRPGPGGEVPVGDARLGDFKLIRELGRGGMGVVFEAEEIGLGRRVALKVLPPHVTLSARSIERFRREAAALGKLMHPGIVPIYRVGEVEGTHYYAMELIEGGSLGQAIEGLRAEPDPAARRLGIAGAQSYVAEVIDVVAQAGEALAAAHAQGILHRDVKPQNLLLGRDGRVRVVDFGLAKDLDRESISRSGEVAGTPHYMSPEQAQGRGELDGRTDVFSLGVVLYELLTLALPFDGDSAQQVLVAIMTRQPVPPRRRNDRIPRDLDSICSKALEKDPRDRYATCADFAADLRRFARLEPIHARPPGSVTRVLKLMRRHKTAVLATVLGFLAVVVAPLVVFAVIQTKDQETSRQRELARANFERGRRLVEQQLARAEQLGRQPGMEVVQQQMAQDAVASFREFLRGDSTDRDLIEQTLPTHVLVARIHLQLGEADKARAVLDEAIRRAPTPVDTEDSRLTLARVDALTWRGELADAAGDRDIARSDFAAAVQSADALVARAPSHLRVAATVALARTLGTWGYSATRRGEDVRAAGEQMDRATALWEQAEQEGGEAYVALDHLAHLRRRCELHRMVGVAGPERLLKAALARAEALAQANGSDPVVRAVLAQICAQFAILRSEMGPLGEADRLFERAIESGEALVRDFPHNRGYRQMFALALLRAAEHARRGAKELAVARAERGKTILTELAAAAPTSMLLAADLADAKFTCLKVTAPPREEVASGAQWEETVEAIRALAARFPESRPIRTSLANSLHELGVWCSFQDDWRRTKDLLAEAIGLQRMNYAAEPRVWQYRSWLIFNLRHLVRAHIALGDADAAIAAAREFLAVDPRIADNLASFAAMVMQAAELKGLVPDAATAVTVPPTVFDEAVTALAEGLRLDPARVTAWRGYEPLRPLLVREDYRAILDAAERRVTRKGR